MFIEELITAGLREKEALIYNTLLLTGKISVNEIIKKTNLKRGIVYKTLYDLVEKGLVSEDKTKKKLHFTAEHPSKISDYADKKYQEALRSQTTINSLLPKLISSFKAAGNKPSIKVYDGIEGIKEAFMDTIQTKQDIYSIRQTSQHYQPGLYEWFDETYRPLRLENKIWSYVILNQRSPYAKDYYYFNPDIFIELRYIEKSALPLGIEMNIYGDKVMFVNISKDSEPFAIVIQNPLICSTQKSLFNIAWDLAGKYSKSKQNEKENNK